MAFFVFGTYLAYEVDITAVCVLVYVCILVRSICPFSIMTLTYICNVQAIFVQSHNSCLGLFAQYWGDLQPDSPIYLHNFTSFFIKLNNVNKFKT